MLGRQAKVLEAFQRTVTFVKTHVPPNANATYAKLGQELADAVEVLRQCAAGQKRGRKERMAATQAVHAAEEHLRERHLKPLSMIARALGAEGPGIVETMRMPRRRCGVMRLAVEASAMRASATKYAAVFVENGRHPEFLQQLDSAIEALRECYLEQARAMGERVGSTVGLEEGMKRARRLVMLLECQIVAGYVEQPAMLAEWRSAKRVQVKTGVKNGEVVEVTVSEADEVPVVERAMLLLEAPKPKLLIMAPQREKVAA